MASSAAVTAGATQGDGAGVAGGPRRRKGDPEFHQRHPAGLGKSEEVGARVAPDSLEAEAEDRVGDVNQAKTRPGGANGRSDRAGDPDQGLKVICYYFKRIRNNFIDLASSIFK